MTKKRVFFCFLCFFKKILAPFIEKTGFAKCTKSSRCLHFERFKAIESSIYSVLMPILYWVFRFWKNCVFYLDRYAYCIFIVIFHKKHEKTRFFLQFSHFRGMLIEKVKVIMQGKAKLPSDLDRIEHTWNSCGVGLCLLELFTAPFSTTVLQPLEQSLFVFHPVVVLVREMPSVLSKKRKLRRGPRRGLLQIGMGLLEWLENQPFRLWTDLCFASGACFRDWWRPLSEAEEVLYSRRVVAEHFLVFKSKAGRDEKTARAEAIQLAAFFGELLAAQF